MKARLRLAPGHTTGALIWRPTGILSVVALKCFLLLDVDSLCNVAAHRWKVPTHSSFAADSANKYLSLSPISDNPHSPDKVTSFVDMEEWYAYHQSYMYVLDITIYNQRLARGMSRDQKVKCFELSEHRQGRFADWSLYLCIIEFSWYDDSKDCFYLCSALSTSHVAQGRDHRKAR